ncbi:MAG: hypothetical protein QNJ89_15290, partial [Acidimicrobiia bacterium]|nr:hypothetical protein [Acidimicrobiia bacterium]
MVVKKQWKVVGGTVAAAVALGSGAAVAQTASNRPETIDLEDVVTIEQVTPATIASLFDDPPTITLEESVASPIEDDDGVDTMQTVETSDSVDTSDTEGEESPESPESVDSTDEESPDSPESVDSTDEESPDSPESVDS